MQNNARVRGTLNLKTAKKTASSEAVEPLGRISDAKIADCRAVSAEWGYHLPNKEEAYTYWWVALEENADGWVGVSINRQHNENNPTASIELKVGLMKGEIVALARALTSMAERLGDQSDDAWKDMPELVV